MTSSVFHDITSWVSIPMQCFYCEHSLHNFNSTVQSQGWRSCSSLRAQWGREGFSITVTPAHMFAPDGKSWSCWYSHLVHFHKLFATNSTNRIRGTNCFSFRFIVWTCPFLIPTCHCYKYIHCSVLFDRQTSFTIRETVRNDEPFNIEHQRRCISNYPCATNTTSSLRLNHFLHGCSYVHFHTRSCAQIRSTLWTELWCLEGMA